MATIHRKRIRRRWIKALRTTDIPQIRGTADIVVKGVCLGRCATSMIADPSVWPRPKISEVDDRGAGIVEWEDACNYVGLSSDDLGKIIRLNDVTRWSFKQIASYMPRTLSPP